MTQFTAYAVYPPGTELVNEAYYEEFDIEANDRTQALVVAEAHAARYFVPGYSHVELGEPSGWQITVTSF